MAAVLPTPPCLDVYYDACFTQTLRDRHPFPIERYHAVRDEVLQRCPGALEPSGGVFVPPDEQGRRDSTGTTHAAGHSTARVEPVTPHHASSSVPATAPRLRLITPRRPATRAEVGLAHDPTFISDYLLNRLDTAATRTIGFAWTPDFVRRTLTITGATLNATEDVLVRGASAASVAAGGTHHAFAARGEGYCIFNDLAVASRAALARDWCDAVCIVDLDVHQGNGTAAILAGDADVFTLSVHGDGNYPWRTREVSDLDVALPDETGGEAYLDAVAGALDTLATRFIAPRRARGERILCLYQAGVDPLSADRWGRLGCSRADLWRRNALVLDLCRTWQLPLVTTMGGGYARPIILAAEAHVDVMQQTAAYVAGLSYNAVSRA